MKNIKFVAPVLIACIMSLLWPFYSFSAATEIKPILSQIEFVLNESQSSDDTKFYDVLLQKDLKKEKIGEGVVLFYPDEENLCRIGREISPKHRSLGIGTALSRHLISAGFENFPCNKVRASNDAQNAIKSNEKSGMKIVGTKEYGGNRFDYILEITREEWENQK